MWVLCGGLCRGLCLWEWDSGNKEAVVQRDGEGTSSEKGGRSDWSLGAGLVADGGFLLVGDSVLEWVSGALSNGRARASMRRPRHQLVIGLVCIALGCRGLASVPVQ